MRNSAVGSQR